MTFNTSRIETLNRASASKHFDAYDSVPWDDSDFVIDPEDPVWELPDTEPLALTAWYRGQPAATRARLGLHLALSQLRVGIDFEGVLSRGLLEYAATLDPTDPAFRYAIHEVAEEAQHTLMFRELLVRGGLPTVGLTGVDKWHSFKVPKLARTSPVQFFIHVLGGEAPIDFEQRRLLRRAAPIHPALERVVRIHVLEEARHISFAELKLRELAPELSWARRTYLRYRIPIILGVMSMQMLAPPRWLTEAYAIPTAVTRAAYHDNRVFLARRRDGLARACSLCQELGLVGGGSERLWRAFDIWDEPPPAERNRFAAHAQEVE